VGVAIADRRALRRQVAAIRLSDQRFVARLAVGVRNKPRSGQTTWAVLETASTRCRLVEVRQLKSDELPEEKLQVVLAIAATADSWDAIIDDASFRAAVEAQRFFITGETPFFIRHLRSILEILAAFR
jgi:hypothetical protein